MRSLSSSPGKLRTLAISTRCRIASRRSVVAYRPSVTRAWAFASPARCPSGNDLVALCEVEDDGLDPLVDRRLPSQPELEEDRVDHLLDRSLGQDERLG